MREEPVIARGLVHLGIMPGCRAPIFSDVLARDGGRSSHHRPQRVSNWYLRPILPPVGSPATRDPWGDISLASVGWHSGRNRLCAGEPAPVLCVMPGCRAPMRSKGKQHFGVVSYAERSIEMKPAVTKCPHQLCTCLFDRDWDLLYPLPTLGGC